MKRRNSRLIWGIVLIVAGILFLLNNFRILNFLWGMAWAAFFVVGGVVFLGVFMSNKNNWWAVIPAFTLFGLAATVSVDQLPAWLGGEMGGALFLAALGLSFWMVYWRRRSFWWAIIPGGVLITIALMAGFAHLLPGSLSGGLFFFGLAVTFGLVYLLPTSQGRMTWALIPALVLFAIGLIISVSFLEIFRYWPIIVILAGLYLMVRALRPR